MATLLIKSEAFRNQVINLKLGINRFGRGVANDFQIEHPTISSRHCEIMVSSQGLTLRDCGSTNGTFVGDEPIDESDLQTGQTLRLGDVEFLVESTEVTIAIPQFDMPRPTPPVVLSDGGLLCPRHPQARVTHQCSYCREVMCDACVHRLRRRGGKLLKLCPLCSHACLPLGGERRKKKSLLGFLHKTVKLPFLKRTKEPK
jgi:FHA domain-containing protein